MKRRPCTGPPSPSNRRARPRPASPTFYLRGYLADLTELRLGAARTTANEAVQSSAAHRAVIEQAKGALMLAHHLDADAAFALLTWHSQRSNRKLHAVASDLIEYIATDALANTDPREALDRVLTGDRW